MHNISLVFSIFKGHVEKKKKRKEKQHFNSTEHQQLRATNAKLHRNRMNERTEGSHWILSNLICSQNPWQCYVMHVHDMLFGPAMGESPNKSWTVNFACGHFCSLRPRSVCTCITLCFLLKPAVIKSSAVHFFIVSKQPPNYLSLA